MKNETLEAAEQVLIESTLVASQAAAAGEAYEYQRADGTIERARNAEEAVELCPVLGRMALEAPDQVSVLLKLAAAGRDIQAAQKAAHMPTIKPEPTKRQESVVATVAPEQASKQHVAAAPQTAESLSALDELKDLVGKPEASVVCEPHLSTADIGDMHRQQERMAGAEPITKAVPQSVVSAMQENTPEITEKFIPPSDLFVAGEVDARPAEVMTTAAAVKAASVLETEILPQAVGDESSAVETEGAYEQLPGLIAYGEFVTEAEVIETYHELLGIAAATDTAQPQESESHEMEDYGTVAGAEVETNAFDMTQAHNFEVFMAEHPVPDHPIALEFIHERAIAGQPLEQTITQLGCVLADPERWFEESPLRESLDKLIASLPGSGMAEVQGQTKAQLTPEMTEAFLVLLRQLGYLEPRETLVNFVASYSLGGLLQAVQYIAQLQNDADRKEFLTRASSNPVDEDDDARLRAGKLIFGLVSKLNLAPAVS